MGHACAPRHTRGLIEPRAALTPKAHVATLHIVHVYSQGVSNDFAARHVPEIEPRGDSLMGAPGRRADKVGAPYLLRAGDARRVAPLWYDYTVRVRNDPEVGWAD